jgi:hypothetical protein
LRNIESLYIDDDVEGVYLLKNITDIQIKYKHGNKKMNGQIKKLKKINPNVDVYFHDKQRE